MTDAETNQMKFKCKAESRAALMSGALDWIRLPQVCTSQSVGDTNYKSMLYKVVTRGVPVVLLGAAVLCSDPSSSEPD